MYEYYKCKENFNKFRILLDGGCSFAVVMVRLSKKLRLEKYDMMQWHTQASNIITNIKVKVYFTVPALSATNAVTWKYHVYKSPKVRCDMILGRDILT